MHQRDNLCPRAQQFGIGLHVQLLAVSGQGYMLEGGASGLAHKLPWHQVAVMLGNTDNDLQATRTSMSAWHQTLLLMRPSQVSC